jgi:hypothetical protein
MSRKEAFITGTNARRSPAEMKSETSILLMDLAFVDVGNSSDRVL